MLGAAGRFNEMLRGNTTKPDENDIESVVAANRVTGIPAIMNVQNASDDAEDAADDAADDIAANADFDSDLDSESESENDEGTTLARPINTVAHVNGVGTGNAPPVTLIKPDRNARLMLAKSLRPFILRRTKEQVAKDLPAKTEQTIFCDLSGEERKMYDELREHYRASLMGTIESVGIKKAKIQVLEALLRLRQASCHPGLIDPSLVNSSSAKLEVLIDQVTQAVEEGHKVLVFSQFTSLLAIVKTKLNAVNVPYEYLDGKTRDRQQRVERFQNDAAVPVFLISLKAGGVGLNLTAADYVFLLDPWWNPAVESQAIDRTHRIGQTKNVFAYRLIARDTVEEKVLQLQSTKRELADAIINADNSLIADLTTEDLRMLLG